MENIRTQYKLIVAFVLLAVVYLFDTLNISANDPVVTQYNISVGRAILLSLTVALPYVLIWAVALLGYIKLRAYAMKIKDSKDGQGVMQLSRGVFWLVLWLPVGSLVGTITKDFATMHPSFEANAQRIDLYFGIVLLLWAYYLLYSGSKKMLTLTQKKKKQPAPASVWPQVFYTIYAILAAGYIFIVFQGAAAEGTRAIPYLPDWVLLLTVIVPRLVMWFFGLHAVYNLYLYAKRVPGTIYRDALRYLAVGLAVVTLCFITIGYLISANDIKGYDLRGLLAIIYALLITMAAGYVIVAIGSTKLTRIEQA